MRALLIAFAILNLSGGTQLSSDPPQFQTIRSERFSFVPSVRARLTFDAQRSVLGWGSFDLTAVPESDEIRVDAVVGVPMRDNDAIASGCKALLIHTPLTERTLKTHWSGVPMSAGMYEAMRANLTIEEIRALAGLGRRTSDSWMVACDERIVIDEEGMNQLRTFIQRFNELANQNLPSAPTPPYELNDDHEFLPVEPLNLPVPS